MRYAILLPVFIFMIGCQKDDDSNTSPTSNNTSKDLLVQTEILGEWEISSRFFGNISDLSAKCCEFLEFKKDSIPSDLAGVFSSSSAGSETTGTFIIDPQSDSIHFTLQNRTLHYHYQINDSVVSFTYTDGSATIYEDWRKK